MTTDNFGLYLKEFKNLSLKEKQIIVFEQLKMLSGVTNQLCNDIGASNELLINKELLDIEKGDYSEDDFAEALIVLVNSVQNSMVDFHSHLSRLLMQIGKN